MLASILKICIHTVCVWPVSVLGFVFDEFISMYFNFIPQILIFVPNSGSDFVHSAQSEMFSFCIGVKCKGTGWFPKFSYEGPLK